MAYPGLTTEWLFVHCFQIELECGNVGFCGGRKTEEPGEKPLGARREPTINSTHQPSTQAFPSRSLDLGFRAKFHDATQIGSQALARTVNPHHDGVDSGIRTRTTLVEGERSHHCATPAVKAAMEWLPNTIEGYRNTVK